MTCPNCSAVSSGVYCATCGQHSNTSPITVWEWGGRFLDEQVSVGGRLPRTLFLLFGRPGGLALEWWAGRRMRFIEPLRLYGLAFLVLLTVLFTVGGVLVPFTFLLPMTRGPISSMAESGAAATAAEAVVGGELRRLVTIILVVLVPTVALVLKGSNGRRGIYLTEHLVVALHVNSALMILLAFLVLFGAVHPVFLLAGIGLVIWFPLYVNATLQRAYGGDTRASALKTMIVIATYVLVFGAVAMLRWPSVYEQIYSEYSRVYTERQEAEARAAAYEGFRRAMATSSAGDTANLRLHVDQALELNAISNGTWPRLYQTAELHLLIDDTTAVRRLMKPGFQGSQLLPMLSLRARLQERRAGTVAAMPDYRRFAHDYDRMVENRRRWDDLRDLNPYMKILEWTRQHARAIGAVRN